MPWPLSQDYNEAIQSPTQCFADPELRQGEAVTDALGLPAPRSGNFADVYAVVTGQRKWAVKCFTRQIPGLQERYQQISLHLEEVKLPFMVDFTFLERGIRVRGDWYPILKMQWVEGLTLNQFVKSNLDKPQLLDVLCQLWVKLATRLREANIAHCDLQHGNVLLVAGERAGKLSVKLVDYDGMCVPALTLLKSIEVGHPAYQHPRRQREGIYSLEVDRFSHLVIYTALRALMAGGKPLWDKHDDGDNLLFKPSDYAAPTKSRLFYEMLKSPSAEVSNLVDVMMQASAGPLEQSPLLEQVAGGLLMAELHRAGLLEEAPLLEQVAATVPREPPVPIPTSVGPNDGPRLGILAQITNEDGWDGLAAGAVNADTMGEFGDLVVQVKWKTKLKRTPSPEGNRTKWAMALGLGIVGLMLAVLGALWMGGVFRLQTKNGVPIQVPVLDDHRKAETFLDLQPKANQKLKDSFRGRFEGNNLAELTLGKRIFPRYFGARTAGDPIFDIGQGVIRLASKDLKDELPEKVEGIKIVAKFASLNILHATAHAVADETVIAKYIVHYADKSKEIIEVVYGKDVRDWWHRDGDNEPTPSNVSWMGSNEAAKSFGSSLWLFSLTWENPHPDNKVVTIDYVSTLTDCAPFLVAMTLEHK